MTCKEGTITAISVSREKGGPKSGVAQAFFRVDHGIEEDAHAGPGIRQISLLAMESIAKLQGKVAPGELYPGRFAENLTTSGIEIAALKPGARLAVGEEVVLEVTQIGKTCHSHCAIYQAAGDCVMPREGVFAKVVVGGVARPGERIRVLHDA